MNARGRRIAFGLVVILLGSLILAPVALARGANDGLLAVGILVEIALVVVGAGIAVTSPPASVTVEAEAPALGAMSAYRGAAPPPHVPTLTKASATRITAGILAALALTAATVPFALHLPRWIEAELVIGAWWAIWSVVLGVVAYRGMKPEDDHRPDSRRAVDLESVRPKPKLSWLLEGAMDIEGCLVAIVMFVVVAIALAGAWLVVELVAPAVFLVAYRGVMRALAKAQAARTRGDAVRSALSGMGWAALGTAPLALVVGLVHLWLSAFSA